MKLRPISIRAIRAMGDKPRGLIYVPNAISQETADAILRVLYADVEGKSQWRGIKVGADSRQVIHYGHEYRYDRSGLGPAPPIPEILAETAADIQRRLRMPEVHFDQHIANRYHPGQGISPHIDHPQLFGDVVLCVTLGAGAEIEFTRGGQTYCQYVEPLSAYVMSLAARHEWSHAIRARLSDQVQERLVPRGTRISLTWRTVRDRARPSPPEATAAIEKWAAAIRNAPPEIASATALAEKQEVLTLTDEELEALFAGL